MNINSIAVSSPKSLKNTAFESNRRLNNTPDSFEMGADMSDSEVDYPTTITYRPFSRKRKNAIESEEKKYGRIAQKQHKTRKEYSVLDYKAEQLIMEMEKAINSKSKMCLNMLKKGISDTSMNLKTRQFYADMYVKSAQELQKMLAELEEIQAKIDEYHTSGTAQRANISDSRIDISPENMEYYKELINFNPYSIIEE